jgi:hypothetical protein
MKKIIFGLAITLAFATVSPAQADTPSTVVILDSGFDSSLLGASVVEELCITNGGGCNNNTGFQIGKGSSGSNTKIKPQYLQDWGHGNEMAQDVLSVNPNAKLILVRTSKVYSGSIIPGNEKDFVKALEWVTANAYKYEIVAVSMSRGSHSYVSANKQVATLNGTIKLYNTMVESLRKGTNKKMLAIYESKLSELQTQLNALGTIACPVDAKTDGLITNLQSLNVATIIATGNDADKKYVDYPSCIDSAVAVSASDLSGQPQYVANVSSNTDFLVSATTTSEATALLAGYWSKISGKTFSEKYEKIALMARQKFVNVLQ